MTLVICRAKPKVKRSNKWPALRKQWLKDHPCCAVCNSRKRCVPHHKLPVHKYPSLELEPNNLVTLCEGDGVNCHFLFGHLGDWRSWNFQIVDDVDLWRKKLEQRPDDN